MEALIQITGTDVLCRSTGTPAEFRLSENEISGVLVDLARRYDHAVHLGEDDALLGIGRELFDRLDANGWATAWARGNGPRVLEIRVEDPHTPLAQALLDAPWELLAKRDDFLADDPVQWFELVRRIGAKETPVTPQHGDMRLLFMAAAPEDANPLDFESEEAAILEATKGLRLHLMVEESGAAAPLGKRLHLDGPFEALHLSCHGDIDPVRGPILALEDEVGGLDPVDAGGLVGLLGDPRGTPLVFLSACRTAEPADPQGDGGRRFEPLVRDLVRAGVPNVLGWDGSVFDTDAAHFAQVFYQELAVFGTTPHAAAKARKTLRQASQADPRGGRHWHLARLYLGAGGGGALAAHGQPKQRLESTGHEARFLDEEHSAVPVASRAAFVGRRRALQAALKAFRDQIGVLVHGMGNLGKSSLAARLASRMTGHKTVVVFGRYDALAVFDRVIEAVPAQERATIRATWRDSIASTPSSLGDALEALLEGPLDTQPILLVVDDLERILETPSQSDTATPVRADFRAMLTAVLAAFARSQTASRLLLTSRYLFRMPDTRGRDLAAGLARIPLRPMTEGERLKQLFAVAQPAQIEGTAATLARRALAAADGNPGLQAILTTPILAGETAVAEQALAAIEHYRATGAPPEALLALMEHGEQDADNALLAYFRRMAFDTYRNALTPAQATMLRAACVFSSGLPIPRPALEAAGAAAEVVNPGAALDRLLGLGLMDDWGKSSGTAQASANPLARPLAGAPNAAAHLAAAALPALDAAWRDADGTPPWDSRAVELVRLALLAPAPEPALLDRAAEAAARHLYTHLHDARGAQDTILNPALERLAQRGAAPGHSLLLIAYDCAERLGDVDARDRAANFMAQSGAQGADRAGQQLFLGRHAQSRGDLDAAAAAFAEAAGGFRAAGQWRESAIARGNEADILMARGELDAALRIRTEEELPVYERLGDVREKAVTQGKIADILMARGELDAALRILKEELLPAFERLGDVRSKAVTQGQIADILMARGKLDAALALHEQRLPVALKLNDIEIIAHIKYSMAALRLDRGDHKRGGLQAIRNDLAEAYAISRKLGRPDFIGETGQLLAQVLAMDGQREAALQVLDAAEAAFHRLDDEPGMAQVRRLRERIAARDE